MKRLISTIATLFLMLSAVPVSAAPITVDQRNTNPAEGCAALNSVAGLGQIFKPTLNRLTGMSFMLASNGDKVYLTITDNENNSLKKMYFYPEESPTAQWNRYDFSEITVTPGQLYRAYLTSTDSPANCTSWTYDTYGNGYMVESSGTNYKYLDMMFQSFGYNVSTPDPETPSTPATPSTPSTSGGSSSSSRTGGSTSGTGTSVQTAAPTAAAVDASIAAPVLTRVEKNGQSQTAPITEISVKAGDNVKLFGTAPAGTKVMITAPDRNYEALTSTNGNWTFELPEASFKEGEIKAQTQKGSKGSQIVKLFDLKLEGAAVTVVQSAKNWTLWFIQGIGILLALIVLLAAVIIIQKKIAKTAPAPKTPTQK